MSIFNFLTLLGGLAMFLYGMRIMGDGLKESSSGALKTAMEHVTNNPLKAFFLGLIVTAIIQSSTATIVITSGLVAAGVISLHQSLGIIIGANIGTTVTGQIIRLLDVDSSSLKWLEIFKPSTLAPIALIIGIVLLMAFKFRNAKTIGNVAIGFGILFTGLLTMTGAVDVLSDTGIFEQLFTKFGDNPVLGYITGAGVAFVLQSSSATIGILQALSASGQLAFRAIYAIIVGIYLGDCVTTAIVCSIGANAEAKRVGIVNILYNLCETIICLSLVTILHKTGVLDGLWNKISTSSMIANTNTIFNSGCAVIMLPCVGLLEKLSLKIVKDDKTTVNKYSEKLEGLSPVFFNTPALALRSIYAVLLTMLNAALENVSKAFDIIYKFDQKTADEIMEEEENIDLMTDKVSSYILVVAPHITEDYQLSIINQYRRVSSEFEHLGDQATNLMEVASALNKYKVSFSDDAIKELKVIQDLLNQILDRTQKAFEKRDVISAKEIEPLEEVVDDMISVLKDNHFARLQKGECIIECDSLFQNTLTNIEHISDTCSNIGVATVSRVHPELAAHAHDYISSLHSGSDEFYNSLYQEAHKNYFDQLNNIVSV